MKPITQDEVLVRAANNHVNFVAFAFGYLRDWSTAEDIVQESYMVVREKWQDYRPDTSIKPWVRSIIRFECLAHLNANKKEYSFSNDYIEEFLEKQLEAFSDEVSNENMEHLIKDLFECMSSLSERSQNLIHDFYVKGRMCKDIAQDEGKHKNSPAIHLYRLRNQLRKCIQKRSSCTMEKPPTLAQEIMDEFFSSSNTETNRITNLIKSKEQSFNITPYLLEWSIFASAIQRIFDAREKSPSLANNLESEREFFTNREISKNQTQLTHHTDPIHYSAQRSPITINKIHYFCAIAACSALVFALLFRFILQSNNEPIAVIATGSAIITQQEDGNLSALRNVGQTIFPGDRIEVDSGRSCLIKFLQEASSFEITGPSKLQFAETSPNSGKKLNFSSGKMLVNLAKQSSEKAFEVETDHAIVKVLGTRFVLEATPKMTTISLLSGRTLVREKITGNEQILTAGHRAKIERGFIKISSTETPINPVAVTANEYSINNTGIIVNYPFDEGTGRNLYDHSGFDHHGTLPLSLDPSDAWIRGPLGYALYFGKRNSEKSAPRVMIDNINKSLITNQLTMSFWLNSYPSKFSQKKSQTIISYKNKEERDGFTILLRDNNTATGGFRPLFACLSSNASHTGAKLALRRGEWYHIAFTFNNGITTTYINGKVERSSEHDKKSFSLNGARLAFGPFTEPYELGLDNLMIFNRILSATELQNQVVKKF